MLGFRPNKPERLSSADVVWAFANILGRHPRGPAEVEAILQPCTDFRDLIRKIAAMPEFTTRRAIATDGFVYDDSAGVQERVAAILRRLEPMRANQHGKIRIGKEADGGYVMLDDFTGIGAAYSVGICDEVSWDVAMAERGIDVFQYDHTIDRLPVEHPRFHWSKTGLGPQATTDLETLPRLLARNGHHGRDDLLLKCDIEGCEWDVLAALPEDCLWHFRQIVIEIHFLERLADPEFATLAGRAVAVLTAGHRVIHVHANNHRPYAIVGGIPLPSVLELTLARTRDLALEASEELFPGPLDSPCYRGRADFRLGAFRF